jgi:hypothetical protein
LRLCNYKYRIIYLLVKDKIFRNFCQAANLLLATPGHTATREPKLSVGFANFVTKVEALSASSLCVTIDFTQRPPRNSQANTEKVLKVETSADTRTI